MSMTGFGRGLVRSGGAVVICDIRTVNNRYLDLNLRVPRPYMPLENRLREMISTRISRGRVDLFLTVESALDDSVELKINSDLALKYLKQINSLKKKLGLKDLIEIKDLLALQGVVKTVEKVTDGEGDWPLIEKSVLKAIDALERMRKREGEALKKEVLRLLDALKVSVKAMQEETPAVMVALKERMTARLEPYLATPGMDNERVAQEIALITSRSDVTEEIARLNAHLGQFEHAVSEGSPVGKRLDFLLQEINREVTTYSNKLQGILVSKLVVEAKSEVEKIREQVQNVE